jgi:hypothetical protein
MEEKTSWVSRTVNARCAIEDFLSSFFRSPASEITKLRLRSNQTTAAGSGKALFNSGMAPCSPRAPPACVTFTCAVVELEDRRSTCLRQSVRCFFSDNKRIKGEEGYPLD